MSRPQSLVTVVIVGSAVVFTLVGVGLAVAGETLIGVIFVAVGLTDLVTVLLLRNRIGAGARKAERDAIEAGDAGTSAEADPSYNPYARED